jgi:hypothetical protein
LRVAKVVFGKEGFGVEMLRYGASVGKESLACTLPSDTRWEEYDRNGDIIGLDEQSEQTLFKPGKKKKFKIQVYVYS